jgi:hypothetical protein
LGPQAEVCCGWQEAAGALAAAVHEVLHVDMFVFNAYAIHMAIQ